MSDIFAYVNAVSHSKKDMMRGTENDELAQKGYNPFMTNRSLSYHIDAIQEANEMNSRPHLDNIQQFDFFINSLRPMRRIAKWAKPVNSADLDLVMEYFGYGRSKAEQALRSLCPDQLRQIAMLLERGGSK